MVKELNAKDTNYSSLSSQKPARAREQIPSIYSSQPDSSSREDLEFNDDPLERLYRMARKFPPLSHEEEIEAFRVICDTGAKREDIDRTKCYVDCHTIRLVIARARKLKTRCPLLDLFQVGCAEVYKLIEKFDPAIGTRFSTFVTPWIDGTMGVYSRVDTRPIEMPDAFHKDLLALKRYIKECESLTGRCPTMAQMCQKFEREPRDIQELLEHIATYSIASLNEESDDVMQEPVMHELLHDDRDDEAERSAVRDEIARSIRRTWETLDRKERAVMKLRYEEVLELKQIADVTGFSFVEVRAILKRALRKFHRRFRLRTELAGARHSRPGSALDSVSSNRKPLNSPPVSAAASSAEVAQAGLSSLCLDIEYNEDVQPLVLVVLTSLEKGNGSWSEDDFVTEAAKAIEAA
jgi:RNA polymerase primary sigma factor